MFKLFNKKHLDKVMSEIQDEVNELNRYVCCFTGHRPQKLPWYFNENDKRYFLTREDVKNAIIEAIKRGFNYFISGMALGYDIMCAELVLELKKIYPHIKLECAIPCPEQDIKWNSVAKARYRKVLSQADKIMTISNHYDNECMQKRNEYMINNSSLVIALYNGKGGGTAKTIDYAKKQNCEIVVIKPIETI